MKTKSEIAKEFTNTFKIGLMSNIRFSCENGKIKIHIPEKDRFVSEGILAESFWNHFNMMITKYNIRKEMFTF